MGRTIDIDRLHRDILSDEYGRGMGDTFCSVVKLIGQVELGDIQDIYCVVSFDRDVNRIYKIIGDVMWDMGIAFLVESRHRLFVPEWEVRVHIWPTGFQFRGTHGLFWNMTNLSFHWSNWKKHAFPWVSEVGDSFFD